MNKIVTRQLFIINSQIIGESSPLSDESWKALKQVAQAPYEQNENFYYIYKSLSAKAAKLGCEIVRLKPFDKENELTALVASLTMLEINGLRIIDYKKDLDELLRYFSDNDVVKAEEWFEAHRADNAGAPKL